MSNDDPASGELPSGAVDITDDAFHGGKLKLLQPARGYRAGMDAVLLAAAANIRDEIGGCDVLDIGAGVGTVGLCLARRVPSCRIALLEKQPGMAALARENVLRNGLSDRVRVVEGDVYGAAGDLSALGVACDAFDHAIANPPYFVSGHGTPSPVAQKAASHEMGARADGKDVAPGRAEDGFDGWARVMARVVKPGGGVTVIHLAEALPDILAAFRGRFGGLIVRPVHPREGAPANRVIVSGTKGSRAGLILADRFVLHAAGGGFSQEADRIFRDGAALAPDASI